MATIARGESGARAAWQARETTLEYLSFLLPLLVVELWLSWPPPVRTALRRR